MSSNKKKYCCSVIHQPEVDNALEKMPADANILDLADMFRIVGDSTRLKILYALRWGELCVCDISAVVNMSQSAVSHQLRVLKQGRVVRNRREGKVVYYALDDMHIVEILEMAMEHILE
mgnify:CR=1 FL=1